MGATCILVVAVLAPLLILTAWWWESGVYTSHHEIPTPKRLHFLWLGGPFPAYFLCTLDFALRFCLNVSIKIHYPLPEGHDENLRYKMRSTMERQLRPLRGALHNLSASGVESSIDLILMDDVEILLKNCGLFDSGLRQRHFGGTYDGNSNTWEKMTQRRTSGFWPNEKMVPETAIHASDILRLVIIWNFGGLYLDSDFWLLDDLVAMHSAYGTMMFLEFVDYPQDEGQRGVNNAVLGFPPQHPFIGDALELVKSKIKTFSIGSILPATTLPVDTPTRRIGWSDVGPRLVDRVLRDWTSRNLTRMSEKYHLHLAYAHWTTEFEPEKTKIPAEPELQNFVNVFGLNQMGVSHWGRGAMLGLNLTSEIARIIATSSAVHLVDNFGPKGPPKHFLMFHLKNQPDGVLAYLHRMGCLAFCDTETLLVNALPLVPLKDYT